MGEENRRDEWRHGVDENLASLNAGQRVLETSVRQLEQIVSGMDSLIRGDVEKETDGLIARLHDIEGSLRELRAVLFVDSTGKKGLIHDVNELQGRRESRKATWINVTAIVVALISSGFLGHFWSAIVASWRKQPDPISQLMRKPKHRHYRLEDPGSQDPE